MFLVKEPYTLDRPWVLSHRKDKNKIEISKSVTKVLRNYHIMGVDFLYRNYRKKFKGAILNEEDGMNMQLQVAAFFNAIYFSQILTKNFLSLIICPDDSICSWHYNLITYAGLQVAIVTSDTCPEDFDDKNGFALLLSFSNIKLVEALVEYDFFSIVVDKFDFVANKLVIRKISGDFNIGLTERSFYVNPDQKLQWTMLNWSNPGCVGKLLDFYEIDNDNFANFRDNYRHWWLRLTWEFCESFERVTEEEKMLLEKVLKDWAEEYGLEKGYVAKAKTSRKRKKLEICDMDDLKSDNENKKLMKKIKNSVNEEEQKDVTDVEKDKKINLRAVFSKSIPNKIESNASKKFPDLSMMDSQSSSDTIINDDEPNLEIQQSSSNNITSHSQKEDTKSNYVKLPSMDENPILSSIIRNFEKSPEPIKKTQQSCFQFSSPPYTLGEPNCSKASDEDYGILLSFITNRESDDVSPSKSQKVTGEQLLDDIFSEKPCTSKFDDDSESDNFLKSLISQSKSSPREKKKESTTSLNEDIDKLLNETDLLLKH